jgi:Coiled-coil domain-containing protein 55 (DUF2040)
LELRCCVRGPKISLYTRDSGVQVAQLHEQALAEDASVFDYDGVYDSIQQQRVQPRQAEKLARQSRYIEGLMQKAVERKKEEDIVYERKYVRAPAQLSPMTAEGGLRLHGSCLLERYVQGACTGVEREGLQGEGDLSPLSSSGILYPFSDLRLVMLGLAW